MTKFNIQLLVCLLAGVALAEEGTAPLENPQAALLRQVAFDQRLNEPVPTGLLFFDEQGRKVALGEYFTTRPVVLALVYYQCPQLCNQVLNGMMTALRGVDLEAGSDFEVVVVSFDPTETPDLARSKKKAYLHRYSRPGAESGIHFLTGTPENIEPLAEAVGFRYQYDERSRQYAHASGIMVATPQGRLSRYFYGIDYSTRDVRLGLVEASSGKIGTRVDQLLLFCFHYDPLTGKYGLAIMNVIRAAAALTVLSLGTFIVVMLRQEKKQRRLEPRFTD